MPYDIVPNESGDAWIETNARAYSPQEISSIVLLKMKQVAEEYLGYEVTDAVITVPGTFQRPPEAGDKGRGPHSRTQRKAHN